MIKHVTKVIAHREHKFPFRERGVITKEIHQKINHQADNDAWINLKNEISWLVNFDIYTNEQFMEEFGHHEH